MSKPTNAPWVSAYLTVLDVDKAVDFYQRAFHFGIRDKAPGEDGTTCHAELTYHDQLIMLGKQGAWGGITKAPVSSGVLSPMNLYVYTDDVDAFYQHATAHQAEGVITPADMFWGDRMCQVKDPDGYAWCFATHSGKEEK